MYTSTNGRRKVVLLGLGVIAFFAVLISLYSFQGLRAPLPAKPAISSIQQENSKTNSPSFGSPVRIIIPKINVNAVLEYVGLTPGGEMDEPTEADNAAWLNRLPLPGETGTSVIAGHFGYKDNKPAVFDNLHKLAKGDEIFVKDSKGADIVFVVRELRAYMPEQDATEVFSSGDGKAHLNLITCKGAWNESLQSYDTRLVVFADKKNLRIKSITRILLDTWYIQMSLLLTRATYKVTRLSSWALNATTIVDIDMRTAPSAGANTMPAP